VRRFVLLAALAACGDERGAQRPAELSYILPTILEPSCATARCHSQHGAAAELVLEGSPHTVRDTLVKKSFVYPGQPAGSPLLNYLRGNYVELRMPPDAPLPPGDIDLITRWIAEGAPP
jgi:hypothetical protein